MAQKKLQKNSILNKYDIDGDNTITNEELAQVKEIRNIENVTIDNNDKIERQEKVYYFLGLVVLILCLWGLWELSVHIWLNYANTVVGTVTGILAIISAIVFFSGSKVLGVVFFVSTIFIYDFLDNLMPITLTKVNEKTEIINEFKKPSKKLTKNSNIKICPSSGYKDNCKGNISYSSGNIYDGFFKNNKRHGKGTYIWKNGDKFTGTYYNGDPSYGTYAFQNGHTYVGNFKNWKMHGQGTYTWKNGDKYIGQWKNDKRHGRGSKTYKNGKIERGIWENGKFLYPKSSGNP